MTRRKLTEGERRAMALEGARVKLSHSVIYIAVILVLSLLAGMVLLVARVT